MMKFSGVYSLIYLLAGFCETLFRSQVKVMKVVSLSKSKVARKLSFLSAES